MIKIEQINDKLYVYTPYNKDILVPWHKLNGKWSSSKICWIFNNDLKEEIENVLYDYFGFENNKMKVVDIEIYFEKNISYGSYFYLFGKCIYNNYMKLDSDCSIIQGGDLCSSKRIEFDDDTTILVRNFYKNKVKLLGQKYKIRNERIINCINNFNYLESLKRIEKHMYEEIPFKKIRQIIRDKDVDSISECILMLKGND